MGRLFVLTERPVGRGFREAGTAVTAGLLRTIRAQISLRNTITNSRAAMPISMGGTMLGSYGQELDGL